MQNVAVGTHLGVSPMVAPPTAAASAADVDVSPAAPLVSSEDGGSEFGKYVMSRFEDFMLDATKASKTPWDTFSECRSPACLGNLGVTSALRNQIPLCQLHGISTGRAKQGERKFHVLFLNPFNESS